MALKQVMEVYELLDSARIDGGQVKERLQAAGVEKVGVQRIEGLKGYTDFIKAVIPGETGKEKGGEAPTLGVVGRLGGIGARPERIGFVSDGDGAAVALATAFKLGQMLSQGDVLPGDVIVTTHICSHAPTRPHEPVPFMDSPVDIATMNKYEIDPAMDAILSTDTTKGNRIVNHRGFAISPTVKEGYILRVSEDLLDIMATVTGRLPVVFAITTQDITPYGNGVFHINSIMQPATATTAPCVGVAITSEVPVAGCATGASHIVDMETAVRFIIETGKSFGSGKCRFHDPDEYNRLLGLYGPLNRLQTLGSIEGREG